MNSSPKDIIKEIETYVKRVLPSESPDVYIKVHDWKHAFRTRDWAIKIAKGEGIDDSLLFEVASLLHDIGRAKEGALRRSHALISGEMTEEYLKDKDWFSEKKKADLIYAIAHHSKGGEGILVNILQDADRLDAFGAIGIIRVLRGKRWYLPDYDPENVIHPFTLSKKKIDQAHDARREFVSYAIDFFPYILTWDDHMNTKTGKELGKPLIEYTKAFLEELKREVKGLT